MIENDGAGTWSWSFGTSDGPNQTQLVTITATDDQNAQATDTFTLTVNNVAPTVNAPSTSPASSAEGSAVTAGADFSDPAGAQDNPFTCTVDYGDGSGVQAGSVGCFHCTGPATPTPTTAPTRSRSASPIRTARRDATTPTTW